MAFGKSPQAVVVVKSFLGSKSAQLSTVIIFFQVNDVTSLSLYHPHTHPPLTYQATFTSKRTTGRLDSPPVAPTKFNIFLYLLFPPLLLLHHINAQHQQQLRQRGPMIKNLFAV